MESPMMLRLRRAPTAKARLAARNWAEGVLVVSSACALTIFALASLHQHSANGPKDRPVDRNQTRAGRQRHGARYRGSNSRRYRLAASLAELTRVAHRIPARAVTNARMFGRLEPTISSVLYAIFR